MNQSKRDGATEQTQQNLPTTRVTLTFVFLTRKWCATLDHYISTAQVGYAQRTAHVRAANNAILWCMVGVWSCCSLALCHQCQYASCFIHMLPCSCRWLGVNCGSSSDDALELQQSYAVPSVSVRKVFYTYFAMLPWSYWWFGVELWWLQCWCTGVAAVLRCAINVSTEVALYMCCHVTRVILMAWRGIVVAPVMMHWSCSSLTLCHQCQYASCFIHILPCYHDHIDGLA